MDPVERMLRNEQELPRNPDEPGLQSKWQAKNLNELTLGYHFNVSLKKTIISLAGTVRERTDNPNSTVVINAKRKEAEARATFHSVMQLDKSVKSITIPRESELIDLCKTVHIDMIDKDVNKVYSITGGVVKFFITSNEIQIMRDYFEYANACKDVFQCNQTLQESGSARSYLELWDEIKFKTIEDHIADPSEVGDELPMTKVIDAIDGSIDANLLQAALKSYAILDPSCQYLFGEAAENWVSSLQKVESKPDSQQNETAETKIIQSNKRVCCVSEWNNKTIIVVTYAVNDNVTVYTFPMGTEQNAEDLDEITLRLSPQLKSAFSSVVFESIIDSKSHVVRCLILTSLIASHGLLGITSEIYGEHSQLPQLQIVVASLNRICKCFRTRSGQMDHPYKSACLWSTNNVVPKQPINDSQRSAISRMKDQRYLETLRILETPGSKFTDGALDIMVNVISLCVHRAKKVCIYSPLNSQCVMTSAKSHSREKFISELRRSGKVTFVLNPGDHWVSVAVELASNSIFVIDSLEYSLERTAVISGLLDSVLSPYAELKGLARFRIDRAQQTGGTACGDFAAVAMLSLAIGFDAYDLGWTKDKSFTQEEQDNLRNEMLKIFLMGHTITMEITQQRDNAAVLTTPTMARRQVEGSMGRKIFVSKQPDSEGQEGEVLGEINGDGKANTTRNTLSLKSIAALNARHAQERTSAKEKNDALTRDYFNSMKWTPPNMTEWDLSEVIKSRPDPKTPVINRSCSELSDIDKESSGSNEFAARTPMTRKMPASTTSDPGNFNSVQANAKPVKHVPAKQTKLEFYGMGEKEKIKTRPTSSIRAPPNHSKVEARPPPKSRAPEFQNSTRHEGKTKVLIDVAGDDDEEFVKYKVNVSGKTKSSPQKPYFAPKLSPYPSTTASIASKPDDFDDDEESETSENPSTYVDYKSVPLVKLNLPSAANMIRKSELRFTTDIDGGRLLMRVDSEFDGDVFGPGTIDHRIFRSLVRSSPWDTLQVTDNNKSISCLVSFSFSSSHSLLGDHCEHILLDLPTHVDANDFVNEINRIYQSILAQHRDPSLSRILTATPHPELCQHALVTFAVKQGIIRAVVSTILDLEEDTLVYYCVQVFGSKHVTRSGPLTFNELPGEAGRLDGITNNIFNLDAFGQRDLIMDYGFNVGVIDGPNGPNTVLSHPSGSRAFFKEVIPSLKLELFTAAMMLDHACNVYGLVHSRTGAPFGEDEFIFKVNSYLEGIRSATSTNGKSHLSDVTFRALLDLVQKMATSEIDSTFGSNVKSERNVASMIVKNINGLAKDPQVMRYELASTNANSAMKFFDLVVQHTPTLLYSMPSSTLFAAYALTVESWMTSLFNDEEMIFPYEDEGENVPSIYFALSLAVKENICRSILTGGNQRNILLNYLLASLPNHNEFGMPQPDIPDDILAFAVSIPGLPAYISSHETVLKLLLRPMMPLEGEKSHYRKLRHAARVLSAYIQLETEILSKTTAETDMETKLHIVMRHIVRALSGDVIMNCVINGDGKTKISRQLLAEINENRATLSVSSLRLMWPHLCLVNQAREDNMAAYLIELFLFMCRKDTKIAFLAVPNLFRFGIKLIGYASFEMALSQPNLTQCGKIFLDEFKDLGLDIVPLSDFKHGGSSLFKANCFLTFIKVNASRDFSPLDVLGISNIGSLKKPSASVSRGAKTRSFHAEFFGVNEERSELLKLSYLRDQEQDARSDTSGRRRERTNWTEGGKVELVLYSLSAEATVLNGKFPGTTQLAEIVKVMAMQESRSQIQDARLDAIQEKIKNLDMKEGSNLGRLSQTVESFLKQRSVRGEVHSSLLLSFLAFAPEHISMFESLSEQDLIWLKQQTQSEIEAIMPKPDPSYSTPKKKLSPPALKPAGSYSIDPSVRRSFNDRLVLDEDDTEQDPSVSVTSSPHRSSGTWPNPFSTKHVTESPKTPCKQSNSGILSSIPITPSLSKKITLSPATPSLVASGYSLKGKRDADCGFDTQFLGDTVSKGNILEVPFDAYTGDGDESDDMFGLLKLVATGETKANQSHDPLSAAEQAKDSPSGLMPQSSALIPDYTPGDLFAPASSESQEADHHTTLADKPTEGILPDVVHGPSEHSADVSISDSSPRSIKKSKKHHHGLSSQKPAISDDIAETQVELDHEPVYKPKKHKSKKHADESEAAEKNVETPVKHKHAEKHKMDHDQAGEQPTKIKRHGSEITSALAQDSEDDIFQDNPAQERASLQMILADAIKSSVFEHGYNCPIMCEEILKTIGKRTMHKLNAKYASKAVAGFIHDYLDQINELLEMDNIIITQQGPYSKSGSITADKVRK